MQGQPGLAGIRGNVQSPDQGTPPLLTATQEGNYNTTEGMGAVPFEGMVLAHSNESEMADLPKQQEQRSLLDRIYIVKVPYCLKVTEEIKIYDKLLRSSSLSGSPCAPDTLSMLAQFSVLSRLKERKTHPVFQDASLTMVRTSKILTPKPSLSRNTRIRPASMKAWMVSQPVLPSRSCRKCLTSTRLKSQPTLCTCYVLEKQIEQEQFPAEVHDRYLRFLKEFLHPTMWTTLAKKFKRPIWNHTPNTARTSSTVT